MLLKISAALLLVSIFYCIASSFRILAREGKGTPRMAKALTWRVALSFGLFSLLLVGYWFGWIMPHPLMFPASY